MPAKEGIQLLAEALGPHFRQDERHRIFPLPLAGEWRAERPGWGVFSVPHVDSPETSMKSPRTPDYALWQNFLLLVGRVMMGWLFVDASWRKLMGLDAFIASLATRRVPYATAMGYLGAAVEFCGGVAILLGAWTRCAALMMIVFVIVATAISHRYWEFADAAARRMQQGQFMKNLAIIGGFFLLAVTGAGRFSVDAWRRR
jgi:putative oxidoreductase